MAGKPGLEYELAEGIVGVVRPGSRLEQRDFNQGIQIRDYDLVDPSGNNEPFEVTRVLLPELEAAIGAHEKHAGFSRQVSGLSRSWHLMSTHRADFRLWTDQVLAAFLADLEHNGVDKFFEHQLVRGTLINQTAAQLGIAAAFGAQGTAGHLLLSPPGDYRGWTSNHADPGAHAVAALEAASARPDNIRKLSVGSAPERHLFIYIFENDYLPWKDLDYGSLPIRAPQLTAPITTGWLVTTFAKSVLCWVFDPIGGWRSYLFDRAQVIP